MPNPATPKQNHTHHSFKTTSPAGAVFVTHYKHQVSGLFVANYQGKIRNHQDLVHHMRSTEKIEVVSAQDHYLPWQTRISEALAEGRTDVPLWLMSRTPFSD